MVLVKSHKLVKSESKIRAVVPIKCFCFVNAATFRGISRKYMELMFKVSIETFYRLKGTMMCVSWKNVHIGQKVFLACVF